MPKKQNKNKLNDQINQKSFVTCDNEETIWKRLTPPPIFPYSMCKKYEKLYQTLPTKDIYLCQTNLLMSSKAMSPQTSDRQYAFTEHLICHLFL